MLCTSGTRSKYYNSLTLTTRLQRKAPTQPLHILLQSLHDAAEHQTVCTTTEHCAAARQGLSTSHNQLQSMAKWEHSRKPQAVCLDSAATGKVLSRGLAASPQVVPTAHGAVTTMLALQD